MAAKDSTEKKSAKASGRSAPSKAEFVRGLPPGTSFAEAEQLAKQKGLEITRGYFYVLRSEQNKGKNPAAARGPRTRATAGESGKGGSSLRLTSDDPHEAALLEAVRALGITRARALLDAVQKLEQGR
jgi:hypothetical protein